jgi:hypothetical protein
MSDGSTLPPDATATPAEPDPAAQAPYPTQPAHDPAAYAAYAAQQQGQQPAYDPAAYAAQQQGQQPAYDPAAYAAQQPAGHDPAAYGYPAQQTGPAAAPAKPAPMALWLSLAAIALLALGLSLSEDGSNAWETVGVWGGFALAAAAATLAPLAADAFKLTPRRAWQIAAGGGIALAAFWVLLVLPSISQNVSFLSTLGCAAGCGAAWLSPGRPTSSEGPGQGW